MQTTIDDSIANPNAFRNIPLVLLILLFRGMGFLPLPVIYIFGVGCGEILYWTYGARRRITLTNLTACFPNYTPGQIRRLARRHFHAMITGMLVMSVAWWASSRRLERLVVFRNKVVLDNLLETRQNVILLAPHFIGLEFFGIYLSSWLNLTGMYQKHKNPFLDNFILRGRARFGLRLYHYKNTLISLIRSIRNGIPFYYLPDQDPGQGKGVFALFYNVKTATYPALSKISRLGNARVVPCMARLRKFGYGFEIIFDQPLGDYPTGDDVKDATTMNKAIERLISHAPEQYFWSHKRFKTRPPGEQPFY